MLHVTTILTRFSTAPPTWKSHTRTVERLTAWLQKWSPAQVMRSEWTGGERVRRSNSTSRGYCLELHAVSYVCMSAWPPFTSLEPDYASGGILHRFPLRTAYVRAAEKIVVAPPGCRHQLKATLNPVPSRTHIPSSKYFRFDPCCAQETQQSYGLLAGPT